MGWERSTLRITGRDTAQTKRILMRLVDTSSLDSRLHHSGKECLRVIHVLSLSFLVVSASVARFVVPSESSLRTWWRSSWLFSVDPRQYIMSTTEELLARLVNLANEAVQARQRQGSAEQAFFLAAPNNISSSYPQEAVHLPCQLESSTRAHWASRRRTGQPAAMDNLAIHVQGIRGCAASEDDRSLRLGDTERPSSCGQQ